ncbi:MAG: GNAT family N-acetyltransferase [Armatimonadetes bacterium]|nr:GNAT family N-acetyltransferase [Armatimonadota bacterium]
MTQETTTHSCPPLQRLDFQTPDVQAYVDMICEGYPDRACTVKQMLEWDATNPKHVLLERFGHYRGDTMILGGFVEDAYWVKEPGTIEVILKARHGLEADLLDGALAQMLDRARERGAKSICSGGATNRPDVLSAYHRAGFVTKQENPESQLNLQDFSIEPFQSTVDSALASGIAFVRLDELVAQRGDQALRDYYDADNVMSKDIPLPFELEPTPYETWEAQFRQEKSSWDLHLCAMDGEEIAGLTMLFRSEADPGRMHTGLTAVKREYRRRGLAKALKALNLDRAKSQNGTIVQCDNEENNPMLQLNIQLGFREVYRWHLLELAIE